MKYTIDTKNLGETALALGGLVLGAAQTLDELGVMIPGSKGAKVCAAIVAVGGLVTRYLAHKDTMPNKPIVTKEAEPSAPEAEGAAVPEVKQ